MHKRIQAFQEFCNCFCRYVARLREILVILIVLLMLGGLVVSFAEDLPLSDSIYFSFITGLTIGYGDIYPETALGRVVSVLIGLIGMVFTGLTVAIATRALAEVTRSERL